MFLIFGAFGQQIVQRQLQVEPTLTIRPGFPVRDDGKESVHSSRSGSELPYGLTRVVASASSLTWWAQGARFPWALRTLPLAVPIKSEPSKKETQRGVHGLDQFKISTASLGAWSVDRWRLSSQDSGASPYVSSS